MPSSTVSPAASASSVRGTTPMPATLKAWSMRSSPTQPAPSSSRVTVAPRRTSMPAPASRSRAHASSSSPSDPAHSRSPISRIVGRSPSAARPEATSTPMKPPPMTVTRAPAPASIARERRASRIATACAAAASPSPPSTFSSRGRAPVAIRHRSNSIVVPSSSVASRASTSSATTRCPVRRSTFPALVPTLWLGQNEVVGKVVPEELLAQRRPVVGQARLVADERDSAVESVPAQRPGAPDRGDPAANEQDLDRRACLSHDGILVVTLR